jgi:hypothetical protein
MDINNNAVGRRKKWTEQDLETVRREAAHGSSAREIADLLNSVRSHPIYTRSAVLGRIFRDKAATRIRPRRRVDGRTTGAKFSKKCEDGLVAQLGGAPSLAQQILISRVVWTMTRLESFDEKISTGEWADSDSRMLVALNSTLCLCLRELGLIAAG